jgi:rsbT co-antagonist protein RsbR
MFCILNGGEEALDLSSDQQLKRTRHTQSAFLPSAEWYLISVVCGFSALREEKPHTNDRDVPMLLQAECASMRVTAFVLKRRKRMSDRSPASNALDPWTILDTLPDYLAVLDASGTIRYLNAAWQQLFGADSTLHIGAGYLAGFEASFAASDIDVMAVQAGLREIVAGARDRLELEFPYQTDGQRRWFAAVALPYLIGGERGTLVQHREVTRRRQAEAQLNESEAELRALFAAMTDLIFVIDARGRYLEIGPTSSAQLGDGVAALVGKTLHELLPAAQANEFLHSIQRALETRQTISIRYSMIVNQAEQWFDATISPLQADRVLWVARDITEIKQEEQRRQSQETIINQQASALIELSTPLIPISDHTLLLPLVGALDSRRAQQVMETLLQGIAEHNAESVILDITGVPLVDTHVAGVLLRAAQAARLLGTRVMLTGIRPEVAQAIVGLGVDLSSIETRASLQDGIAATLGRARAAPSGQADR